MDIRKFYLTHEISLAGTVLFVTALLVRLIFLFLEPQIPRDGVLYLNLIEAWFRGGTLDSLLEAWSRFAPNTPFYPPPLFLYLTKLGMSCGLTVETAGRTVSLLFGSLVPVLAFLTVREWTHDRRIRYGVALLALLHPGLVELSAVPLRDSLSIFLSGAVLFFLSRLLWRRRFRDCIYAGGAWGAAVLTRYENWELLVYLVGILLCMPFFAPKKSGRWVLSGLGGFGGAALAAVVIFGWVSGFGMGTLSDCARRYVYKQIYHIQQRWKG